MPKQSPTLFKEIQQNATYNKLPCKACNENDRACKLAGKHDTKPGEKLISGNKPRKDRDDGISRQGP